MPFGSRLAVPCVVLLASAVLVSGGPGIAQAYPGGTPGFVTDVAPFCTGCHSSVSEAQLAGAPPERVQAELVEKKHLARIRAPREGSGYAELSEEQRAELIAGIQAIDAAAKVRVLAPKTVAPGSVFEVTVEATGGAGPVVGVALVDAAHRWQARPAAAAGWQVLAAPRVIGPDGKDQTRFTDGRAPGLAPGISYVNVYGLAPEPAAGKFDTVRVIYQLRAPAQTGSVPLGAVFLYGTEKASPHGTVETMRGRAPVGGRFSASGRVRFSPVLQVEVK